MNKDDICQTCNSFFWIRQGVFPLLSHDLKLNKQCKNQAPYKIKKKKKRLKFLTCLFLTPRRGTKAQMLLFSQSGGIQRQHKRPYRKVAMTNRSRSFTKKTPDRKIKTWSMTGTNDFCGPSAKNATGHRKKPASRHGRHGSSKPTAGGAQDPYREPPAWWQGFFSHAMSPYYWRTTGGGGERSSGGRSNTAPLIPPKSPNIGFNS